MTLKWCQQTEETVHVVFINPLLLLTLKRCETA